MPVKVDRSDIPLLVIGVGGTGKDIALSIKRKFIERFKNLDKSTLLPQKTAFLTLDGDTTKIGADPRGLIGNEHCDISFPNLPLLFEKKSFTQEEQSWVNPNLTSIAIMNGAGGIRQVGRIQLFRNMNNVIDKLMLALNQILGANMDNPPDQFSANILICSSLSGGTGSGASLDMAYIVRQLVRDHFQAYETNLKVYGMFLMPECIIQHAGDSLNDTRRRELRANAFAAMKEIDYWMRQEVHGDVLTVNYPRLTAQWDCRPFNYLGYLGHTWENGLPINNAYEEAVNKVAEMFLLLSTETPTVADDKLTPHTIYSSLSNAGNEMLVHSDDCPYPVSAWAMSLGSSEYSSFEKDIQNYEIQKTLNQVLSVQLFNASSGDTITETEARINNIPTVVGTLGLSEAQDDFFSNLTMDIETEKDFRQKTAYPFNPSMWTKEGVTMNGASLVGDVRNFYMNRQTEANDYYSTRFQTMWQRFTDEAKKAITNIQCGPVAFLKFLDEVYIPDVANALEEAKAVSAEGGEGRAQADVFAEEADRAFDYLEKILHPGLNPQLLIAAVRWDEYARNYEANLLNLSSAEWNWRCMSGKAIAVTTYLDKLKNYRENLSLIIDTVKKQEEKLTINSETDMEETSLLTFDQLRKYLEGVNLPNSGIAEARGQVLRQIADLSFELPNVDLATSFEERARLFGEFVSKVRVFVEDCFTNQNLTNMDRVLDAAVAGTDDTAQNYMATVIAPKMTNAAMPMLHLKTTAKAIPNGFYEYHHVAVPEDAPQMVAGLAQYNKTKGDSRSDYSKSTIVDRMMLLNLKVCIPMYLMMDAMKLMKDYEDQLNRPTNATSQGIHLVGTNQINALSDTANTVVKSWRRLPCPIPPVEIGEAEMSSMQKDNLAYLEKRFTEALDNGIISFAGEGGVAPYEPGNPNSSFEQETFVIHGFTLGNDNRGDVINNMMLEDICDAIDSIKLDESMRPGTRLQKLRMMRSGDPIRSIHYGKYLTAYATALQITPIQPNPDDDRSIRAKCAARYEEARTKLCSYMLGTYPKCLDLIEKEFKVFTHLHEAEKYLETLMAKEDRLTGLINEYSMLFVNDVIIRKADWFGLNVNDTFHKLFQNDSSIISMDIAKEYPEAAFVLQIQDKISGIGEVVLDKIEEEKKSKPADALAISEMNMANQVLPLLREKVQTWNGLLSEIKANMEMSRAEKEKLKKVYDQLLTIAKSIESALT